MRWLLCGVTIGAMACTTETWIFAPDDMASLQVAEGVTEIGGTATLTYASDGLPRQDLEVSNALRLTAESDPPQGWVLAFPNVAPGRLVRFQEENQLNVEGVYRPCDEEMCVVEVRFLVSRAGTEPVTLELSGDAIVSQESVVRELDPADDRATLTLSFDE